MTEWALQEIKKRYYFPGITAINNTTVYFPGITATPVSVKHHADCAIFRSLEQYDFVFCSCGLLHDLEKMSEIGLVEIIYPRYQHDVCLQERGEDIDNEDVATKVSRQKEKEDCRRILVEVFGPPDRTSLSEIKKTYEEYKRLLLKVFGKKFTNAFFHLDEWLKKQMENYRHSASGFSS